MSWARVKLGEISKISAGGDKPKVFSETRTDKCFVPIYSNGIEQEGLYGYTDKAKIKGDTITISARGNVGTAFYRKDDYVPIVRLLSVVPNNDIVDSRYLYYLLKDKSFLSTGAAQQQITVPNISNYDIRYENDLLMQKRIASILSAYDDLIEVNRKQIKLLEEAAERLYREWFIDLRFPGHETATFNADGLPEGWKKDRLDTIANIVMGQSPSSDNYNDAKIGLPFHQGVTTYGNRFVVDNVYSAKYSKVAEQLDVLFSVRAPVGRLNITKNKIAIGRGLSAIRHKENLQSFLFYALKNEFYKEDIIGNGSIFSSITKEQLYSYKLVIPTIELQKKYDEIAREIDKQILGLDSQMVQAAAARDLLLPRLMNGEIQL